jgi:hypothetical protein
VQWQDQLFRGGEENLNLIFSSVYHVMNITCIHLRVKGLNICMHRKRRIYKEPLKKYNNKKINTYLIPHHPYCWPELHHNKRVSGSVSVYNNRRSHDTSTVA